MTDAERDAASAIVDQWFWQPAEGHNYRYRGALRTLVRFYESAPMEPDVLKLVTEYLRDQEISGGISLCNKLVDLGSGWKSMDCWYQTAAAEKWNGTDSTKVRVYQVLMQQPSDGNVVGPYTVESGCQYAVTHEFYWDVSEIPAVPASSSGVNYALQGVVRDRETGLYSCVLECRTRVQQDIPEYTTSKTEFADTKEEQHIGVMQRNVASAGKPASVGGGTTVTRKLSKNADCTFDVQNVTTVDKPVPGEAETVVELASGTRTTTENRNMASKAPAANLAPGESVRNEKTSSGLWNQTIVRFARNVVVWIGERCHKTIFAHVHDKTTNVKDKPSFDHVVEAGGGKVVEKSVRKTDDGYQIDEKTTEEQAVENAAVEVRRTLRGTSRSVTHRNQSAPLDMTGLAVGEQRSSRKTDGGRYDNTSVTTDMQPAGGIGESCERSAGAHTHTTTENLSDKPNVETGGASPNHVVRKRAQKTEQGTWDLETTNTTLNPATAKATGGSQGVQEEVESGINAPSAPSEAGGVNVEVSMTVTPNDHGTVSYTKRKRRHSPTKTTATSNLPTETRTTTTTANDTSLTAVAGQGSASAQPNGMGGANTQVTEVTPHPIDSGWITWTSTNKTARGTYTYKCGVRVFKNLASCPTPPGGVNGNLSVGINQYGLYDGCMTYSELQSFAEDGSGGQDGGSAMGRLRIERRVWDPKEQAYYKELYTASTCCYYGRGNDGSEAADAANNRYIPGVHLPPRTYITSEPTYTRVKIS